MSCDIHSYVEVFDGEMRQKVEDDPIRQQSYRLFGWLADVRNYSEVQPLSQPRGLPADVSDGVKQKHEGFWELNGHSHSWLSLDELLLELAGGVESRKGPRGEVTLREFLGQGFLDMLEELKGLVDPNRVRIVFWFDN